MKLNRGMPDSRHTHTHTDPTYFKQKSPIAADASGKCRGLPPPPDTVPPVMQMRCALAFKGHANSSPRLAAQAWVQNDIAPVYHPSEDGPTGDKTDPSASRNTLRKQHERNNYAYVAVIDPRALGKRCHGFNETSLRLCIKRHSAIALTIVRRAHGSPNGNSQIVLAHCLT